MNPNESPSLYDELVDFLINQRKDVRKIAADGIVGLSEDPDFLLSCHNSVSLSKKVTKHLLRNIGSGEALSSSCLTALINLCHIPLINDTLLECNAIRQLMDNLRDQQRDEAPRHEALNLMVLVNLTRSEKGQLQFLGCTNEKSKRLSTLSCLFLQRLIKEFVATPTPSRDGKFEDKFLWIGHILVNISSIPLGQMCLFMDKTDEEAAHLINALSAQLLPKSSEFSPERRDLVIQVFLHLSVEHKHHQIIVSQSCKCVPTLCSLIYPPNGLLRKLEVKSPLSESGCLFTHGSPSSIIPPRSVSSEKEVILNKDGGCERNGLVGPSGEKLRTATNNNVERDVDPFVDVNAIGLIDSRNTRMKIFDTLLLLSASEVGRQGLRRMHVYEVLRLWHLMEKDDEILTGIESMVHLLVFSEEELKEQDKQLG